MPRDEYQARGTKCTSWTEHKPGKKTKPMGITQRSSLQPIGVAQGNIEYVERFTYLGSVISSDGDVNVISHLTYPKDSWTQSIYRSATISHDWHSRVRNDFSRSPKVNDFRVMWKGLCDFLLGLWIIALWALSFTVSEIGPTASFRLKTHIFLTITIQHKIWKCFLCTASPEFCMPRLLFTGLIIRVKSFPLRPTG